MHSLISIILALIVFPGILQAQQFFTNRLEAGIGAGILVYQGDLTPEKFGAYKTVQPQFSIFASYLLNRSFSVRGNIAVGRLRADETKYEEPAYRAQRGLKFSTPVSEFSGLFVWDIFGKNGREYRKGFAPYVFAGVGVTLLNINRDWSAFNPEYFGSENLTERLAEDLTRRPPTVLPVLPVGVGVKYFLSDRIAIKAETNYQLMATDRLDGVSSAGNPNKGDKYYGISLGAVFSLGYKNRNDCPAKP